MRAHASSLSHLAGCGWFWTWALVGVGFGFAISTIGFITVPLALLATFFFLARRRPIRGAFGIATGVGLVLLRVAYVAQRDEYTNPVPWLIVGLVLVTGGIVAHARQSE